MRCSRQCFTHRPSTVLYIWHQILSQHYGLIDRAKYCLSLIFPQNFRLSLGRQWNVFYNKYSQSPDFSGVTACPQKVGFKYHCFSSDVVGDFDTTIWDWLLVLVLNPGDTLYLISFPQTSLYFTHLVTWALVKSNQKSNQIRFISGNMAHKSYKLVQKQRQRKREIKTYNIQHTQHTKFTKCEIHAWQAHYCECLHYCQI